ncbi:DUF6332 family protein [Streptomyces sp. NPDC001107]
MHFKKDRRSERERDADTVEIMYALASAAFLGAIVFGVIAGPALVWNLSSRMTVTLLLTGLTAGAVLAVVRVVHVLRQHARQRARNGG